MKSIVKEIIVLVLLLAAIFLGFAVIFYDYMPISIVVPENVQAYQTPSEVAEKAEEDIVQYEKQNVAIEITGSDLNSYKKTGKYKEGKDDPFLPKYKNTTKEDEDSVDIRVKMENQENNITTDENQEGPSIRNSTVIDTRIK